MPSDFPRHHRSTSPDRAEVLMVVLVTIASAAADEGKGKEIPLLATSNV